MSNTSVYVIDDETGDLDQVDLTDDQEAVREEFKAKVARVLSQVIAEYTTALIAAGIPAADGAGNDAPAEIMYEALDELVQDGVEGYL